MSNPAETYERDMVPALFAPWAPLLLDLARVEPGERVLDVACGTGIVARGAAKRAGAAGSVAGIDLNPAMVAVARAATDRENAHIDFREGRAEALPFADGGFDVVLCQQGLQFMPDKAAVLAEMRRVAKPGGRIALALWCGLDRHPFFATMNDVIVERIGIPALAAPFTLGDAGEIRRLLESAGCQDIVVESRSMPARFASPATFVAMEVDVLAAAVPSLQHLDEAGRRELARSIEGEMEAPIRELVRGGKLEIPMHSHLARARR